MKLSPDFLYSGELCIQMCNVKHLGSCQLLWPINWTYQTNSSVT